jgi:hypothetical protein
VSDFPELSFCMSFSNWDIFGPFWIRRIMALFFVAA